MVSRYETALMVIREAGDILRGIYGRPMEATPKGAKDFVLPADLDAERIILRAIQRHFPTDQILSEEAGALVGESDFEWIIDPLDGTANFQAGIPYFAVSICLREKGELRFALVFNPLSDELFSAELGGGATLNGASIGVSTIQEVKQFLFAYASSAHSNEWMVNEGGKLFHQLLEVGRAVRLQGSSLLDMCGLAAGRFDGLVKLRPKYWDIAAGCLMIREAGGVVTDALGAERVEGVDLLIASNGKVHAELISSLKLS